MTEKTFSSGTPAVRGASLGVGALAPSRTGPKQFRYITVFTR